MHVGTFLLQRSVGEQQAAFDAFLAPLLLLIIVPYSSNHSTSSSKISYLHLIDLNLAKLPLDHAEKGTLSAGVNEVIPPGAKVGQGDEAKVGIGSEAKVGQLTQLGQDG